jgi:hypothetical protein
MITSKLLLPVLLLSCIPIVMFGQIPHNPSYTVYKDGPALTLNAIANPTCGTCGTCTQYSYYSASTTITGAQLTCNFAGARIIDERKTIAVRQNQTEGGITRCVTVSTTVNVDGTFLVTGVDFKWNAIGPFCRGTATINLSNYISYSTGVTFSGPGVTNGTFNPASAGAGVHTLTASRTFDNGVVTRSVSVTVYGGITFGTVPADRTICAGETTTFTAAVTAANPPTTFQWQYSTDGNAFANLADGGVYSGVGTSTLTLTAAPATLQGYSYRVIVQDQCGGVTQVISPNSQLSFRAPVGFTQAPADVSTCAGQDIELRGVATGTSLTYQWQLSSDGSSWTNISDDLVYAGTKTTVLKITAITTAHHGRKYRLVATGTCGTSNSNAATITVLSPPTITTNPVSVVVCEASSAALSVAATGTSLTYQWQFSATGAADGYGDVIGATSATYTIGSVQRSAAGFYRVQVRNACVGGLAVSGSASLSVNALPSASMPPQNTSVCVGSTGVFSVTAAGFGSLAYQWEVSTNNGSTYSAVANSSLYTGVATNTLAINGAITSMDGYRYRVRVTGSCGAIQTTGGILTVNTFPSAPTASDVARCGNGSLSSTAVSSIASPVFRWYVNTSDATPVYTGATYLINNLTSTVSYYVSVSSSGCESPREQVIFTQKALQPAPVGSALTLCAGQGTYNLEEDITDQQARGSNFTWTGNGINYSGKNFDPSIGRGTYTVSYDPPASAKNYPACYTATTRTINVVTTNTGDGGIVFQHDRITGGNIINMCVGDAPINLAPMPSVAGGAWTTVTGTGLSYNGSAVIFTPSASTYTETNPNTFRYTATVGGCSVVKDLKVYVKDNLNAPIVSGLPAVVCPANALRLTASVSSPASFSFNWYRAGESQSFASGSSINYVVEKTEALQVRSIDDAFGCPSPATIIPINTPFGQSSISVNKPAVNVGDYVSFSTDALESGNSFYWIFGDGAVSTEPAPNHFFYTPGDYTVQLNIVSNLGCASQLSFDKITVTGERVDIITGVDEHQEGGITLYPNPFRDFVSVSSVFPVLSISLVDNMGRKLSVPSSVDDKVIHLDTESIAPGVFMIIITTSQGATHLRLLKL